MEQETSLHNIERTGMRGATKRRRPSPQQRRQQPPKRPGNGRSAVRRNRSWKKLSIIAVIVFIALILLISTTFASGTVKVQLAQTLVTLDTVVTATRAPAQSGDISFEVRTPSSTTKTHTITSFKREVETTRARGTITIYNTATTGERLDLVSRTRFQSKDGRIYRLLSRQSIPGGKTVEGEFIPGSKEVQVEANEVGDSFNLDKGTDLSIPGLAKYKEFGTSYAITETRIVGGFDGERFIPDEKEEAEARAQLKKEIEKDLREKLTQSLATNSLSERVVFESGIFITYESLDNEQTESSVILRERGTLRAIEFRESDLASFIIRKTGDTTVAKENPSHVDIEGLSFETNTDKDDVQSAKEISFRLLGEAPVYWDIDRALFKSDLKDKKKGDVQEIITELYPQVVSIKEVSVFPVWRPSLPGNKSKINIETVYED